MEKKDYIIGIDIGSSNVVMAVGERNSNGEISILGVDVQKVNGCVVDGDITNFLELGTAIKAGKSELEKDLGITIHSAYVGFSGRSVYCVRYEDYVEVKETVVESDVRELHNRIQMAQPAGGDDILERILLRYNIDDRQETKNPIGAFGRKLSATYLLVLASKHQIDRVDRAMHYAEIKVCGMCVNPTLVPQVLLNDVEREEGVAIVDMGSDLTDISIVRGGKLWHFASMPIGASTINNDLYEFLKIPRNDIEMLKRKYGNALADSVEEDKSVPVRIAGRAKKQILLRNIAEITEERLKDIANFVLREIKSAKFYTKIPCGVVITGGCAYLENCDKLFAREMQMEVRVGKMLNGIDDESQQKVTANLQATAVGLLLYGAKHKACDVLVNNLAGQTTVTPVPPTPPTPPVPPVFEDSYKTTAETIFAPKVNEVTTQTPPVVQVTEEKPVEVVETAVVVEQETTPIEQQDVNNDVNLGGQHDEEDKQKNETTTIPEEEINKESTKSRRGFMKSIREWLDGVFEGDDEL